MINYQTKCNILADLWSNYREDEAFSDFIEYNDLGLPLAYFLREGMVNEVTTEGQKYINETFYLFIAALEVTEKDIQDGMSLTDLLEMAEKKQQ